MKVYIKSTEHGAPEEIEGAILGAGVPAGHTKGRIQCEGFDLILENKEEISELVHNLLFVADVLKKHKL